MKQTRQILPLLFLCLLLAGCQEKAVQKEIFAMDTVMSFTAYGDSAEPALNDAIQGINQAERELDPELETSIVYALNHANGAVVELSPLIYEMLTAAKDVYMRSGGALDLTVYPAVTAWGFIDGQYTVPKDEALVQLKEHVAFSAVTFWEENGAYYAQMPAGMELSFGAVAKGAMADRVVKLLETANTTGATISLGGNVQTLGTKPDGTDWKIAVQDPGDPAGRLGILSVTGTCAVVTSGSYQRYFQENGKIYHHILDPDTLSPADTGLVSVTIVTPSGAEADCLSTAMFVLGEDGALDYWRTYGGFEMLLVTDDGRVIATEGLNARFTLEHDRYTYTCLN